MKRRLASVCVVASLVVVDVLATCGGGGGGGTGGMGGGAMGAEVVYQVPWKLLESADQARPGGLVLYWFPASANELQKSSLRNSRTLSLYASQCVTMGVADATTPVGQKLLGDEKLPVAILASADGAVIGKAQGENGMLKVGVVEKLLDGEMKQRENGVKTTMTAAKDAAKKGDKDAAIAQYKSVLE